MNNICQGILLETIIKDFKKINRNIEDYTLNEDKKAKLKESIKVSQLKTIKTIKIQRMKNEVILTYLIPDEEEIKIFGEKFVKNNNDKCYFFLNI